MNGETEEEEEEETIKKLAIYIINRYFNFIVPQTKYHINTILKNTTHINIYTYMTNNNLFLKYSEYYKTRLL